MACPLRYYYNYVQHVPRAPNIHLVLGRAMHDAVEAYARAKIAHARTLRADLSGVKSRPTGNSKSAKAEAAEVREAPDQRLLHAAFEQSWKPDGCGVDAAELQRMHASALEALTRYHALESAAERVPSQLIEAKFVLRLGGRVRVSGVWDRVDLFRPTPLRFETTAAAAGAPTPIVAVIKEYKKALSEYQLKTAKSSLQLHMYAWAFEAVFGFAPQQVVRRVS